MLEFVEEPKVREVQVSKHGLRDRKMRLKYEILTKTTFNWFKTETNNSYMYIWENDMRARRLLSGDGEAGNAIYDN